MVSTTNFTQDNIFRNQFTEYGWPAPGHEMEYGRIWKTMRQMARLFLVNVGASNEKKFITVSLEES